MILASWNINSVRIRLEIFKNWVKKRNPSIVLLQEIKCESAQFPVDFFLELGFKSHIYGQKGRNGVAILVKKNLIDSLDITTKVNLTNIQEARIIKYSSNKLKTNIYNIYAPNGNPISDSQKFSNKIEWYEKLIDLIMPYIKNEEKVIVGGDFNVLENEKDVNNFNNWINDALGNIVIRKKFREILGIGMINIIRDFYEPGEKFSFWDYQKASWERNDGLLIDHFLISPNLLEQTKNFGIDSEIRGLERPSDHTPIWIDLS
ncbi:exodeoxyribonuclease III [Rickettsiales bacterium]|nr:exodeoxyribonuclease III [Rickettsiales bacterium]